VRDDWTPTAVNLRSNSGRSSLEIAGDVPITDAELDAALESMTYAPHLPLWRHQQQNRRARQHFDCTWVCSEAKRAQEAEKGKEAKDREWWECTEGVLCR